LEVEDCQAKYMHPSATNQDDVSPGCPGQVSLQDRDRPPCWQGTRGQGSPPSRQAAEEDSARGVLTTRPTWIERLETSADKRGDAGSPAGVGPVDQGSREVIKQTTDSLSNPNRDTIRRISHEAGMTGFEPAISALTGQRVGPLHHTPRRAEVYHERSHGVNAARSHAAGEPYELEASSFRTVPSGNGTPTRSKANPAAPRWPPPPCLRAISDTST
jgi:hypothetical protein